MGLTAADLGIDESIGIWPDVKESVEVFIALGSQWNVGMGGPVGLVYASIPVVMDAFGVKDRKTVFEDVRVMESEALEVMRKR